MPSQVAPQIADCGFGEVQTPLLDSVRVYANTSGGEDVTLYEDVRISELSATIDGAATSGTFNIEVDVIGNTRIVDLGSGLEAEVVDIDIEATIPGLEDAVTLEDGAPFPLDVKGGFNDVSIVAAVTIEVLETRESCFFLASTKEDADGEITKIRKFTETANLEFSFVMSGLDEGSLLSRHPSVVNGEFGAAIALSENYLAVGEPGNDHEYTDLSNVTLNSLPDSGAVHIYERVSSADWSLCAILKASNALPGDAFGSALAWSDGQLIVGSPLEDRAGGEIYYTPANVQALAYNKPDSGAVYVYENTSSEICGFEEIAYIKNPDNPTTMTFTDAHFGASLNTYGSELIIGAPRQEGLSASNVAARFGRTYLYKKNALNIFTASVVNSSPVKHDREEFGASVSISERLMVIGAPGDSVLVTNVPSFSGAVEAAELSNGDLSPLSPESGGAHVYLRDDEDSAFVYWAYLKPNNSDDNDRFGTSVATSGNLAFVGAPNEDSGSNQRNAGMDDNAVANNGAVYQYFLNISEDMALQNYIKPTNTQPAMNFGANIDASPEFLAVSAPGLFSSSANGDALGGVEIVDYLRPEPNRIIIVNDAQAGSALERVGRGLDYYGPNLALGAPFAIDDNSDGTGLVYILD